MTSTSGDRGSSFQDTVYALVHAYGGLEDVHVTILTNERLHEHTVVFDFCHALIDARGVADLLTALTTSLKNNHAVVNHHQPLLTYSIGDFSKLIPHIDFDGDFAPHSHLHSVLKCKDVFRDWECPDNGDVAISIDRDYVNPVHSNLRQQSATFTGLWLWELFKVMTELVSTEKLSSQTKTNASSAQYLSVSVLVDIRP